mmetsp:Transcript_59374/g.165795  ORF Transcript_59374/g.165795 Transcript_59374/m.165795 type:complete len:224 (-) Transcript_59374:3-674(-)
MLARFQPYVARVIHDDAGKDGRRREGVAAQARPRAYARRKAHHTCRMARRHAAGPQRARGQEDSVRQVMREGFADLCRNHREDGRHERAVLRRQPFQLFSFHDEPHDNGDEDRQTERQMHAEAALGGGVGPTDELVHLFEAVVACVVVLRLLHVPIPHLCPSSAKPPASPLKTAHGREALATSTRGNVRNALVEILALDYDVVIAGNRPQPHPGIDTACPYVA